VKQAGLAPLIGATLAASLCFAAAGVQAAGKLQTVVIEGLRNTPEVLTVKRGDTVVWVNKDPFPHTVTSRGNFDSKAIPPDGKWKYVARKAGTYDYICTFHPNMKGTLKVE
jgi:plastocyanin